MPFRKWDPLQDLFLLHQDLFGEASDPATAEPNRTAWSPAVDIYETPEGFMLRIEVPGIEPNKIKLEFRELKIIISGERPAPVQEGNRKYHHVECVYGSFERIIALPPYVCCQDITAHYKDGVLEIFIPKTSLPGPKTIAVQG